MDFFKGVIQGITHSDRKSQIKELCEKVPSVHRVEHGKYQLMLQCPNTGVSSILITILDTFPNTKPILSVQGPLQHPWVDAYRFISKSNALNSWNGASSSLADVILEVKGALESGHGVNHHHLPPNPTRNSEMDQEYVNISVVDSSDKVEDSTESETVAAADSRIPLSTPDVPTEFPKLNDLTEQQLIRLLSDDVAFDIFRKEQNQDNGMSKMRDDFLIKNVESAEANLAKQPLLTALHSQVNDMQDLLQVEIEQYQARVEQHTKKNYLDKADVLRQLEEKADAIDTESEALGGVFLAGEKPLNDFLKEYTEARIKYHSIVAKVESATATSGH